MMAAIASFILGSVITVPILRYWTSKNHTNDNEDDTPEDSWLESAISFCTTGTGTGTGATSPARSHTSRRSMTSHGHSGMDEQQQVNFLTDLVKALWPEINASISQLIRESCEEVFSSMTTPKIQVTKVQLGTVPIVMDNIHITRQKATSHHDDINNHNRDSIRLTMDVVWNGNCDMEFKSSVFKFGIERLKFHGRLVCLIVPLTAQLPLIGAVQYAFANPPKIDLAFTGVASIAEEFQVLQRTVKSTIETAISPFVLPNKNHFKVDPLLKLVNIYQPPLGVLRITIVQGTGFLVQRSKLGLRPDIPDVYCHVRFGIDTIFTTSVIEDCTSPIWNESFDVMFYDMDQIITLHAWDRDIGPLITDDDLGIASITIQDLILKSTHTNRSCVLELQTSDHRPTGASITMACQVLRLAMQDKEKTTQSLSPLFTRTTNASKPIIRRLSSQKRTHHHHLCGLLTVLVQGASNLPLSKEKASSFIKVKLVESSSGSGGTTTNTTTTTHPSREMVTATVVDYPGVDALNPVYEAVMDIPLTLDMLGHDLRLELWNGTRKDCLLLLGSIMVPFQNLLSQPIFHAQNQPIGNKGATLEYSVLLRCLIPPSTLDVPPVIPTTSTASWNMGPLNQGGIATASTTAAGGAANGGGEILTVQVLSGRGFPIQKRRLKKADIPDIYLCIRCGTNPSVWRTPTVSNSTNPVWEPKATHDFFLPPGMSASAQTIDIRAFDEDKGRRDKDDPEGQARVSVGNILLHGSAESIGGAGGTLEVELQDESTGQPLGRYVTLHCQVTSVYSQV